MKHFFLHNGWLAFFVFAFSAAHASTQICTGGALTIPDTDAWVSSTLNGCSGSNVGYVRKVTLTLTFNHPRPSDLNFIVQLSNGGFFPARATWAMGAAGGSAPFTGTITLDDGAPTVVPTSALADGQSYQPARYDSSVPPPLAASVFGTSMFALDGSTSAPGVTLYALDHAAGGAGSISGWSVSIDYSATPLGIQVLQQPSIFWQNTSLDLIQAWTLNPLLDGEGIFFTQAYNVNHNWHLALGADFNGDGISDLVWINDTTHDVQLWLMAFDAHVTSVPVYNVAPPWQLATAGHFFARDIWDLAWVNPTAGVMQIWFMDPAGTGNVGMAQNYSFAPGWALQTVGDFYGRGQHDLLWRGQGVAQIWSMDGAAIRSATNFDVAAGWEVGGVGDFDGDGRDDIVWINSAAGVGQIWLMHGDTISAAQNFALPAAPWVLLNVQPYRLTGTANMLWYNPSLNVVQVWTMDGFSITSAVNAEAAAGWTPH